MDAEKQVTWGDLEEMAREYIDSKIETDRVESITPRNLGELLLHAYQLGMQAQRYQTARYLDLHDDIPLAPPKRSTD